eukprot:snap_masked-scaffold154_size301342-processed-gene-0.8 protein:Tk07762 transcript:snap_masked-scaffold154_size301342-processed-gene-0.8-mRNA-1 annotation:"hypothetical protein DAPPUDRAFT_17020"
MEPSLFHSSASGLSSHLSSFHPPPPSLHSPGHEGQSPFHGFPLPSPYLLAAAHASGAGIPNSLTAALMKPRAGPYPPPLPPPPSIPPHPLAGGCSEPSLIKSTSLSFGSQSVSKPNGMAKYSIASLTSPTVPTPSSTGVSSAFFHYDPHHALLRPSGASPEVANSEKFSENSNDEVMTSSKSEDEDRDVENRPHLSNRFALHAHKDSNSLGSGTPNVGNPTSTNLSSSQSRHQAAASSQIGPLKPSKKNRCSKMARLSINARERRRMHDLNDALDDLRHCIPYAHSPSVRKLSKIATLLLAKNYILMQSNALEELRRLVAYLCQAAGISLPNAAALLGQQSRNALLNINNPGIEHTIQGTLRPDEVRALVGMTSPSNSSRTLASPPASSPPPAAHSPPILVTSESPEPTANGPQ